MGEIEAAMGFAQRWLINEGILNVESRKVVDFIRMPL